MLTRFLPYPSAPANLYREHLDRKGPREVPIRSFKIVGPWAAHPTRNVLGSSLNPCGGIESELEPRFSGHAEMCLP